MNSKDVLLQAAFVFRSVRAVRAVLLRVFAALDSQVILHVSQPTITFVALWASEATWLLVQTAARFPRHLDVWAIRG